MPGHQRTDRRIRGGKKTLDGEERVWFELAYRQRTSVDRCRCETTSTQFLKWVAFLKDKRKEKKREFYYLAAVRFQVYLIHLSLTDQSKVDKTIEDFLLEFEDGEDKPDGIGEGYETEEQYEKAWKEAQSNLFAVLGVVPNQTNTKLLHVPAGVKVTGIPVVKSAEQNNTPPFISGAIPASP